MSVLNVSTDVISVSQHILSDSCDAGDNVCLDFHKYRYSIYILKKAKIRNCVQYMTKLLRKCA